MGYNTVFKGELKFIIEPTAKQLVKVKSFLGEDCRDHPEWGNTQLTYIDLVLLDDFSGLKWDDSAEKTYDLPEKINLIIQQMQKKYPDFGLSGKLLAQGEDADDRWFLMMIDGEATKEKIPLSSDEVICPHCGELFMLSQIKKKRE